jgi:hypothetical protein
LLKANRASQHERVVALGVVDLVELPHIDVDPVRDKAGADPSCDLRGGTVLARCGYQDCHLILPFP